METFFGIKYEFDRNIVCRHIDEILSENEVDYICVADGVILNTANRDAHYLDVINGGLFSICDSSYVPLYIKWIYGIKYHQYSGSQIFMDLIQSRKYRMIFMGTSRAILNGLKKNLLSMNSDVADMQFVELPYRQVDDFDYEEIARTVHADGADIIWVALGAPKQEIFMSKLKSHLHRGVMIAVGAAFKFYSGIDVKRAPQWMIQNHLEFVYRIFSEPKKQIRRCGWIMATLPGLLYAEWRRKNERQRKLLEIRELKK